MDGDYKRYRQHNGKSGRSVIMMIGDFGGIHLVHQGIFKKIAKETGKRW